MTVMYTSMAKYVHTVFPANTVDTLFGTFKKVDTWQSRNEQQLTRNCRRFLSYTMQSI